MTAVEPTIVTSFIPPFQGYAALLPLILLLIAGFWALFANLLPGKDRGASFVGLKCSVLAALGYALIEPGTTLFGGRYFYSFDARFAAVAICILAALWCLWTLGSGRGRTREAVAFAMMSTIGATIAVAATDLIVLVLALELATMPAYVLVGYRRYRIKGLEGAMKYFLLSVLTTLIMLYGMSFLVGLSASTTFAGLSGLPDTPLTLIAVGMTLLGLFAKLSAAPFHWWAPDAYEGAESWALAFAAIIPKVAVAVVLVRFTFFASHAVQAVSQLVMIMAILSMIVGSFAALMQVNIRRLVAYSGVSSAGFILFAAAVMAMGGQQAQFAFNAAIIYVIAAALASMGVLLISAHEGGKVADLSGLSERKPFFAWGMALLALSLIGVPPTLGFFAKFNIFLAAISAAQYAMVVMAVIMAVVSAFYYVRLIRASFFGETYQKAPLDVDESSDKWQSLAPKSEKERYSICATVAIALIVLATLSLGVLYNPLMTFLMGS